MVVKHRAVLSNQTLTDLLLILLMNDELIKSQLPRAFLAVMSRHIYDAMSDAVMPS
jgi:hypothetical protein